MKSEIHAVAAFTVAAAAAVTGVALALLGFVWGAVLAGGALCLAALIVVAA